MAAEKGMDGEMVRLDRAHVWHPFTPFSTWMDEGYEPTVIVRGRGSRLFDAEGREYLDGNSSIWVNLHGHCNAQIDRAIRAQLKRIAHSSFLGLTNEVAPRLAARLLQYARPQGQHGTDGGGFERVFFSDDGSTAVEAAIKVVYQAFQMTGQQERTQFVSLGRGYHGDTVGAMSVGHSAVFHGAYRGLMFSSGEAMSPACYRCPFNRAAPERADARTTRQCGFECVGQFARRVEEAGGRFAGAVLEPVVQGAAGMVMHPEGYLSKVADIVHDAGGKLILDEVMTGFHRTGQAMAFHAESCQPDVVALAKGLTGGYLPLAATLVKADLVEAFMGGPERTFYHGHSYSGNQLGCAAALANLDLLEAPGFGAKLERLIARLGRAGQRFWAHPHVGDVRQQGTILAVELVEDWGSRKPFAPEKRLGWRVSEAAKKHGLLTRPAGDVLILMPPLSTSAADVERMVEACYRALCDVLPVSAGV